MADPRFFKNSGPFSLEEIIKRSNNEIKVDEQYLHLKIKDVAPLSTAGAEDISFLSNRKYLDEFKATNAGFCLVSESLVMHIPDNCIPLITKDSYYHYAVIANMFYPPQTVNLSSNGISDKAKLAQNISVGHNVVIEEDAEIGEGTYIDHGAIIKKGVIIGKNCFIGSGVVISHSIVGDNVVIHPGAKIGQDGFGFATKFPAHIKVPQLGRVLIGNDVEVGANTTIDRGAGPDTIIGNMCKIDNLVQIGHNVEMKMGCIIVAGVGIAGSTKLEEFVVLGGQVGVAGHLTIGKGAKIAAQSGVIGNVEAGASMGGYPAMPLIKWHKQSIYLRNKVKGN